MSETTIPKGSIVLVTGVNGFVGLHVADQLLEAGYKVRGTVRDDEKATWTKEFFDEKYGLGNFEVFVLKDIASEGAFDQLIKGCSGVAHVASDTTFGADPNKIITPIVNAMNSILYAAALEPSVKSFVYTSSSAALSVTKLGVEYHLDDSCWNEYSVSRAWEAPPYEPSRAFDVYCASKTQAEQAAWKVLKNGPANFKYNSINPNLIVGKLLHEKQGKSSTGWMLAMRDNNPAVFAPFHHIAPQWEVDVVDVAKLHVIALTDPAVSGERLLAYLEKTDFNSMVESVKAVLGEEKVKHLEKIPEQGVNLGTVDTKRTVEVLKSVGLPGFKPLEQSLRELFASA